MSRKIELIFTHHQAVEFLRNNGYHVAIKNREFLNSTGISYNDSYSKHDVHVVWDQNHKELTCRDESSFIEKSNIVWDVFAKLLTENLLSMTSHD